MKNTYSIAAVLGAALTLLPCTAFAQAPTAQSTPTDAAAVSIPLDQQPSKAQVAKLLTAMRLREQMDAAVKSMTGTLQQQIKAEVMMIQARQSGDQKMTPEQQNKVTKLGDKYAEKILTINNVDDLMNDMTAIYQKHFTRADVDAYIVFYQTPAGQHMLDQQPLIMKEYSPVVMKRTQDRAMEINKELLKEIQTVIKPAETTAAPATPEDKK